MLYSSLAVTRYQAFIGNNSKTTVSSYIRRPCTLSSYLPKRTPFTILSQKRFIVRVNVPGQTGSVYMNAPVKKAGLDELVRHTELYDGFTDDHGVYKEGPPTAIRLEYVRSPEHGYTQSVYTKRIWSPFQTEFSMQHYTPLYYDHTPFASRDEFGHRRGSNPGDLGSRSYYEKNALVNSMSRVSINHKHILRVPKWLACICNYEREKSFVGFFLYANGAYVAELLTFKQLPRIIYNKPFQSSVPTIGQTVDLSEVTYGKELHSVEMYPGKGGKICRASGTSVVVLRGTEPNLVPLLLPSKEVRLFDTSCMGIFGRRAGVMYRKNRYSCQKLTFKYTPHRPRQHAKTKPVSVHPAGGGNGTGARLRIPLDYKIHPRLSVKTKYWLSGYILRSRQYQKNSTMADIRSKSYSWATRDKVYR